MLSMSALLRSRHSIHAVLALLFVVVSSLCGAQEVASGAEAAVASTSSKFLVPLSLFVFTLLLGIVATMGGVGGSVLFVPLVAGFAPFHLDFVRGAGLCVALASALSAGPNLMRSGMVNLRISMPLALVSSISAIVGARIGLALPVGITQTALGVTILGIAIVMLHAKGSEMPLVKGPDALSAALRMNGVFYDQALGQDVSWQVHRTPLSLGLFFLIGIMAGMFGLGAGWANVPVLNLVMGAPLKVAVATSMFILSVTDTTAAWVYLHHGAILAMIAIPSIAGIMIGSRIGVRLLKKTDAAIIRKIVITMLILAGLRALLKGLGLWN